MNQKTLLVLLLALTIFTLTACSNEESYDFETVTELKNTLVEDVTYWENISYYNEIPLEQDGEIVQKLFMEIHRNEDFNVFIRISDVTDEDNPIIFNYMYVDDDIAYSYENCGITSTECDGDDIYERIQYTTGDVPHAVDYLVEVLEIFPSSEVLEDDSVELTRFDVEWEQNIFDVVAQIDYTDEIGEENYLWTLSGSKDNFKIETPNIRWGNYQFIKQDFFETFEGIDYSKFD